MPAIVVNGREHEAPEGATVADLLAILGLPRDRVAVERNRDILPRDQYGATLLAPGDVLEIVQLVGGG